MENKKEYTYIDKATFQQYIWAISLFVATVITIFFELSDGWFLLSFLANVATGYILYGIRF